MPAESMRTKIQITFDHNNGKRPSRENSLAYENRTAERELEKQANELITRADLVITETKTLLNSRKMTGQTKEPLKIRQVKTKMAMPSVSE